MRIVSAVAALTAAATFALGYGTAQLGSPDGVRGPLDVVGAFAYHLDRGNFGKACGLYAQSTRGGDSSVETCSGGFVYNAGANMTFFGADIFDDAKVVPGSEKIIGDNTRTYLLATKELPPAKVTVKQQDNGRWRITRIG